MLDANETYRVGLNAEGEAEARQLDQVDGGEVVDGGDGVSLRGDVGEVLEAQEDARHRAQGGALRRMHQVEQRQARTAPSASASAHSQECSSLLLAKTRTVPSMASVRPPPAGSMVGAAEVGRVHSPMRRRRSASRRGARMERGGLARKVRMARRCQTRWRPAPEDGRAELQPRAACGERRIGLGVRGERAVGILQKAYASRSAAGIKPHEPLGQVGLRAKLLGEGACDERRGVAAGARSPATRRGRSPCRKSVQACRGSSTRCPTRRQGCGRSGDHGRSHRTRAPRAERKAITSLTRLGIGYPPKLVRRATAVAAAAAVDSAGVVVGADRRLVRRLGRMRVRVRGRRAARTAAGRHRRPSGRARTPAGTACGTARARRQSSPRPTSGQNTSPLDQRWRGRGA